MRPADLDVYLWVAGPAVAPANAPPARGKESPTWWRKWCAPAFGPLQIARRFRPGYARSSAPVTHRTMQELFRPCTQKSNIVVADGLWPVILITALCEG